MDGLAWFIVVNATFNKISAISLRSVLLVEDIYNEKTTIDAYRYDKWLDFVQQHQQNEHSLFKAIGLIDWFLVLNSTFSNISAIL